MLFSTSSHGSPARGLEIAAGAVPCTTAFAGDCILHASRHTDSGCEAQFEGGEPSVDSSETTTRPRSSKVINAPQLCSLMNYFDLIIRDRRVVGLQSNPLQRVARGSRGSPELPHELLLFSARFMCDLHRSGGNLPDIHRRRENDPVIFLPRYMEFEANACVTEEEAGATREEKRAKIDPSSEYEGLRLDEDIPASAGVTKATSSGPAPTPSPPEGDSLEQDTEELANIIAGATRSLHTNVPGTKRSGSVRKGGTREGQAQAVGILFCWAVISSQFC